MGRDLTLVLGLVAAASAAACVSDAPSPAGRPCTSAADCGEGYVCDPQQQMCVAAQGADFGPTPDGDIPDAGGDEAGASDLALFEGGTFCSSVTCPEGCCHPTEGCLAGDAPTACGVGGAACKDCAADGQECVTGSCGTCDSWMLELPAAVTDVAVSDDGLIYITGTADTQAYLATLDGCGRVLDERTFIPTGSQSAGGLAVAVDGTDLVLGGHLTPASGPAQGWVEGLSRADLSGQWSLSLGSAQGDHRLVALALSASGPWLVGSRTEADATTSPWGARVDAASASGCAFDLFDGAATGHAAGASPLGQAVYLAGSQGAEAFLARYGADDCSTTACAPCPAPWVQTYQYSGYATEARAVQVTQDAVYWAGSAAPTVDSSLAVVYRIDPTTGAWVSRSAIQRSSGQDLYTDLVVDGDRLYVAGGVDVKNASGTSYGLLAELNASSLATILDQSSSAVSLYGAVALYQPRSVILVAGDGSGYVRRMKTSGL